MAEDLTAEYSYKQDIQNLTTTDSLTSLKNRVSFDEFLYEHSSNTTFPLSIITCDINTFQIINSTFGYDIGNAVLIKISTVIHETLKLHSNATAYRIGGDEFAIILTTSTKDQTKKMIHSLKSQIEDMNDFDFKISISFGYAYTSDFKTDKIKLYNTAKDEMNTNKIYDGSTLSKKTIDVIMNTLFDKSPREQKHSKRVGSLSKQIAESFKLGISFTNRTELAGTLHDIGKINIPETILEKNGPLSKEERIIINKHPESSYKILHSVPEYKHVANIVLSHHERYDGTGYPQKLKGKYIPLESRIISVADAYDAMTVERAYRVPLSKDEAILELLKHSDTQFDREVVQTFIKLIQKDKNVK
jgi:diguanylate cyclase (GGDEF)-like protein/putative nucleotidyltransferase with HDIG domain